MKLIRNALITPDGTVIESRHRHDYVTHVDANGKTYMVDGGLDYQRRSMHGDEVDVSLFDTEPHHIQRCILNWERTVKMVINLIKEFQLQKWKLTI